MRVINDFYKKDAEYNFDERIMSENFYNRTKAVREMYEYLDQKGILKTASFEYFTNDYGTSFAVDTKDLECYREEMLNSGTYMPELAVRWIFDEEVTPCIFCGAIKLSWTMLTYRDNCGCVGKSWECGMCNEVDGRFASKIAEIRKKEGVKAAVSAHWADIDWERVDEEEDEE